MHPNLCVVRLCRRRYDKFDAFGSFFQGAGANHVENDLTGARKAVWEDSGGFLVKGSNLFVAWSAALRSRSSTRIFEILFVRGCETIHAAVELG